MPHEEDARAQRRATVRAEAAARESSVVDVDDLESDEEEEEGHEEDEGDRDGEDDEEEDEEEDEDEEQEALPQRRLSDRPSAPSAPLIRPPPAPTGSWVHTHSPRHQKLIAHIARHRFWTGQEWYLCHCQGPTCRCGMASSDEEQSEGVDEDWYSDDPYEEIDPNETRRERQRRERDEQLCGAARSYREASSRGRGAMLVVLRS